MQLIRRNKISFGDFRIVGTVCVIAILILWLILRTYIVYFNISTNYAYTSILKQNYIPTFKDDSFKNSKETFFGDLKSLLGVNLVDPLSIVRKEFNVISGAKVDESKLLFNTKGFEGVVEEEDKRVYNDRKKRVLIYHTHTTEAFKPANNDSFYEQYNIVGVGDVLKKELEKKYNVEIIHDKTIHNTSYLESYKRSGETLEGYLNEIDDIDLIIDLHRDSLDNKKLVTAHINDVDVAKIMFVVAKNNLNYLENEDLAQNLTDIANELYPGFARSVFYYERGSNAFNQTKSSKLALIEVGAQLNTVEEAINSAKLLSNVIGEYFERNK